MKLFALPDAVPDVPGQLYNLKDDPGKTRSLYFQHPEVVRELKTLLEKAKTDGAQRSDAESLESAGRNSAIAIGFALAR